MISASLEEVLAAIQAVDPDLAWEEVASSLLPVFRRRRPFPGDAPTPLYVEHRPGVEVGIGVDIGPAFLFASAQILEGWGVTAAVALDRAIENVRLCAQTRQLAPIFSGSVGGVPTRMFQTGQSIGSALLLVPDELVKHFGYDAQFLLAPMRDLLVSITEDAGLAFAEELYELIAEDDPNCLDLPVFSLIDGELRIASVRTHGSTPIH